MYDVLVIGAGVVGCGVARALSRYRLRVCVAERTQDICEGTSKANSGIVHAGYDAPAGSLKAAFNVKGNERMEELSKELDFAFRRNGSMVLCFSGEDRPKLEALYERGLENKVPGLSLLSQEEAKRLEPGLGDGVVAALYAPTGGIVCPFELTYALAENAFANGVEFFLETEVLKIEPQEGGYRVLTGAGMLESRTIVNAAGVYADVFHNMVSERKLHITARRGEYFLLDKQEKGLVSRTIFQLPGKLGKGALVTPTVHGNLLLGPTAESAEDKEAVNTTASGLRSILEKTALSVKNIPLREGITSFAGLRAHEDGGDFILGEPEDAPGFFDAAGIESPGLTCAPVIGEWLAQRIASFLSAAEKPDFIAKRKGIAHASQCSEEEFAALIAMDRAYGNMICRCEGVTEGEIVDAIRRPLGARTLDGIKRRTRAGMGRCQAGFCTTRVMEILMRELSAEAAGITKKGRGSELLAARRKELPQEEEGGAYGDI